MGSLRPRCSNGHVGTVFIFLLLAIALAAGECSDQCVLPSQEAGATDASVLYQHNIRVRSDIQLLDKEAPSSDKGKHEASYAEQIGDSWQHMQSFIQGTTGSDFPGSPISDDGDLPMSELVSFDLPISVIMSSRDAHDLVTVTRKEDKHVVMNVKNDVDNVTTPADVTSNISDVKVDRTVVKGDAKSHNGKHVMHTDVTSRTKNETETEDSTKGAKEEDQGNASGNATDEKPFAKENTTVQKKTVNITRQINATHSHTQSINVTETVHTVDLDSSFHIVSIYLVLFVPVIFAWAYYVHHGMQAQHYLWLLPLTMCTMSIGQDLVNQSLTMILEAPNAISAIQGFSMTIATGLWLVFADLSALRKVHFHEISSWAPVAACFAVYQIMNHLGYATCSLSERIVITNLSPLISLLFERVAMPTNLKPDLSFGAKSALSLMAIGALLFGLQNPSFTPRGICVALLMLITTVPYRLGQRRFLAGGPDVPLSTLACIDGFVLGVPSVIISAVRKIHLVSVMEASTEVPVMIMLSLSVATFVGLHICGLSMLRMGSATTYLVFSNVASLVTVALGIFFFGDKAFATALASIGLFANVASGIWYSAEVQIQSAANPLENEKTAEG